MTALTFFGISLSHHYDSVLRMLLTAWRLVSILCCCWTVVTWEKEAFSR